MTVMHSQLNMVIKTVVSVLYFGPDLFCSLPVVVPPLHYIKKYSNSDDAVRGNEMAIAY